MEAALRILGEEQEDSQTHAHRFLFSLVYVMAALAFQGSLDMLTSFMQKNVHWRFELGDNRS